MKSSGQVFVSSALRCALALATVGFVAAPLSAQAEIGPTADSFSNLSGARTLQGAVSFSQPLERGSRASETQGALSQGEGARTFEASSGHDFGFDHGEHWGWADGRVGGWVNTRGSWNDPGAGWGDHGAWGGGGWLGDHGGGWDNHRHTYTSSPVPEPVTSMLTLVGLAAVFLFARRTGVGRLRASH